MAEDYEFFTANNSNHNTKKHDLSFCDIAVDFERLRLNALTKAAEISPQIKEVTIGPKRPLEKNMVECKENEKLKAKAPEDDVCLKEAVAVTDLQYTAAIKLYETTLKENTEAIFNDLIFKMIAKRAEYMKKYWTKQSEACERRALELKTRKQQMLKELQNKDNFDVLKKSKQDEQNSQYIHMKTMENMNRILEEQNKAASRFASITNSHTRICVCYNEISTILEQDNYANKVSNKYFKTMNSTVNSINQLLDFSKNGNVTEKEVVQAEILAINMENIKKQIIDESKQLQEQEKQEIAKLEETAKLKEIEELKKNAIEQKEIKTCEKLFYSEANYAHYEQLQQFLSTYENSYKDLMDDVSTKKFRFDCQKAVNTPVNAIASVSGSHLRDKYDKLSKLLRGDRVEVLDTFVVASQHPQGIQFCTALLAKKIVLQGSSLISSRPESAFPLAAVTVALWSQFPEFGCLLEANFHRLCPYIVPMFLPQKENMSDKDFYLLRGYTYSEEGVVEKQDKFLKRMSGIFTLYCAICISQPPRFLNANNPHGLKYGWKWLASFINLKPEPDICATLLYDFFTVCGSEFSKYYGIQFRKIIKLIVTKYLAILDKIDEGGPKTRLEVLLQNILKTGHIPPPNGLLPQNIW